MEDRTERQICDIISKLVHDHDRHRWTKSHLETVFSLGLTALNLNRSETYKENEANGLIMFIFENLSTGPMGWVTPEVVSAEEEFNGADRDEIWKALITIAGNNLCKTTVEDAADALIKARRKLKALTLSQQPK